MDILSFFEKQPDIFLVVVGVFSLFIGSFLNVVIYRLPKMIEQNFSEECRFYLGLKPNTNIEKVSLYLPFSQCTACKKVIKPWHNIPILSYIWLRGKCAYCSATISVRYPMVEALTCLASLYTAKHFGVSWQMLAGLFFTWVSICLIFIDLDYHLLPDQLTFLLLWAGLAASIFNVFCNSHEAILGAILGYLIFASVQWIFGWFTGKTGLGQGDFKYLAAMGGFFGWQFIPLIILLASTTGLIFIFTYMVIRWDFKSTPFSFGPYLAMSGWITLLWGQEIIHYYLTVV